MSSPSENPYEPPVGQVDAVADSPEQLLRRCSRPGMALMIMGSIHSVFPAIAMVTLFVEFAYRKPDVSLLLLNLLVFGSYFLCALLIAIGGAKMAFMESYPLARWGAILACIPVISPFIVWGIPFGIWALVVLGDPNVQAAFKAKCSKAEDSLHDATLP